MSTNAEEIWKILREAAEAKKETERMSQETERISQETKRMFQETERMFQETDRRFQETDRQFKDTDRKLKQLGKQIGGLGEKFGSFTEGLALPSMEKILRRRFGMDVISPSVRARKNGTHMEIDVLAYANRDINKAFVVEVKSHPRDDSITQIQTQLERFRDYFPEHKDKVIYGILAAVDLSASIREKALREGLYVARIHDNVFKMDTPEGFQPKAY